MKLPLSGAKKDQKARIEPEAQLNYLVQRGRGIEHPPELGMILFFQAGALARAKTLTQIESLDRFRPQISLISTPRGRVGMCSDFGIGGPAATVLLELLIASGIKRFFFIGSAGAIDEGLSVGDIVLCDEAIRDEGVSYHYLPADEDVRASRNLLNGWKEALNNHDVPFQAGVTWTTDAPFRETESEVSTYRSIGGLSVEMECASIYAVAQFRGVEAVCGLSISDSLAGAEWKPQFHYAAALESQMKLFEAALEALQA